MKLTMRPGNKEILEIFERTVSFIGTCLYLFSAVQRLRAGSSATPWFPGEILASNVRKTRVELSTLTLGIKSHCRCGPSSWVLLDDWTRFINTSILHVALILVYGFLCYFLSLRLH